MSLPARKVAAVTLSEPPRKRGILGVGRSKVARFPKPKPEWYVKEIFEDSECRDEYTASDDDQKNVSCSHIYGTDLLYSLQAIQQQIVTANPPGLYPIIACCLEWGAQRIAGNEYVNALVDLSKAFKIIPDDTPGVAVTIIREFYDSLDLPIDLKLGHAKQIRLTRTLWEATGLSSISANTGVRLRARHKITG